jgi:osmoprotectant transport system ATP-binding protein
VAADAILQIRGLSCALGGRMVLRNITLDVGEGDTLALLGRSGSGKTTLLKTINGLVKPTAGEILFQGKSQADWDLIQLRRQMGYVIQDAGLFPHWNLERNISLVPRLEQWPPDAVARRVDVLLEMVGMPPSEFRHRYPGQLSGGQRQRAGIARALAANPPLLLLDEPFASLDPITRFDLQRQFVELRNTLRKSSLFVTHDVREALLVASRIALLHEGRLELVAPAREFRVAANPEARAFLESLGDGGRLP